MRYMLYVSKYWQTDRQTDRHQVIAHTAQCIFIVYASFGKNRHTFTAKYR